MNAKKKELTRSDKLRADLVAALEDLDEEGLVFLLEQANVLLHNARVEELERKRSSRGRAAAAEAASPGKPASPGVEQSADGKTFVLIVGEARKVLSLEEMRAVVRVCHAAGTPAEASRRLYALFSRERRDILLDGGIRSASSPLLAALAAEILARYRPKE